MEAVLMRRGTGREDARSRCFTGLINMANVDHKGIRYGQE